MLSNREAPSVTEVRRCGNPSEEPSEVTGRRFVIPISGTADDLWQRRFHEAVNKQLASHANSRPADHFVRHLTVRPERIEFLIGDGDVRLLSSFLDVVEASIRLGNQLVASDRAQPARPEERAQVSGENRNRKIDETLRAWAADHPIEDDEAVCREIPE
jgi:hypothetical protein